MDNNDDESKTGRGGGTGGSDPKREAVGTIWAGVEVVVTVPNAPCCVTAATCATVDGSAVEGVK